MVVETAFLFFFSHQKFISYRFTTKWKGVQFEFIQYCNDKFYGSLVAYLPGLGSLANILTAKTLDG